MNFELTADQKNIQNHLSELLKDVCSQEYVRKCDETETPPREAFNALAKNGWLGLIGPEEYGGAGGTATDLAIMLDVLGYHFEELGLWVFRNLTYGCVAVLKHGSKEQIEHMVPKVLRGELSFCFGLTEPDSGSDASALKTRAIHQGDHFLVNGRKVYTSGMDISDYCILVTRTNLLEKKQQGITNFLVDTKLPGIEVKKLATLGQRSIGTTEVLYSDVKVPANAILGELDQGWKGADTYLCYERLCLSAARTGAARAAFDFALEHAKTRVQFGKPIGKFQAVSHKLADMKAMLDIAQTMVYRYAWLVEQGKDTRQDAAILKLYTSESYKSIADMSLQILGGYGYCMEYPLQRFFRDSRLATIGGGTSEIQRNIIATSLGL
ncbi:MAG: acyl-CoA dehydrogenase family protein [Betaproteobacteria bacterium]|jgi:alkylation response protein AidB-like acyl-CoA dehydrogenase|nr:acyl-CoA/acyl-ACP dehydrogenase [Polynucleobacter sp.]NBY63664.1 acyl-CoA dehydrogenase [Betaproteobacteria bacterium]